MKISSLLPGMAALCLGVLPQHIARAGGTADLIGPQARLGTDLIERIVAVAPGPDNVLVSPATLAGALGLAGLGASAAGQAAIAKSLGFGTDGQGPQRALAALVATSQASGEPLQAGVALALDRNLPLKAGLPDLTKPFGVTPIIADLGSQAGIEPLNAFVKRATGGAIPAILAEAPQAGLISLAALSFKARWQTAFKPNRDPLAFHRADGSIVSVPVMTLYREEHRMRSDERFAAVELPYIGERYRMVIVTDRGHVGIKPGDLKALASWIAGNGFETGTVDVILPRFTMQQARDLKTTLDAMGLTTLDGFPQFTAEPLPIGQILQKTLIKVDEQGTETAAASAVLGLRSMPGEDVVKVAADSRFLFALCDRETGLVLAAGLIGDPSASGE